MHTSELISALTQQGVDWQRLSAASSAIILFGSQAGGCASKESDWDLLCVGERELRSVARIDLVWVANELAAGDAWLGSELANHVSEWGVVLWGVAPWLSRTVADERAIARKHKLIQGQLSGMLRVWERLAEPYRERQMCRLRRDLQRFELLHRGQCVPPTALLDRDWEAERDKSARLSSLAELAEVMSPRLERLI